MPAGSPARQQMNPTEKSPQHPSEEGSMTPDCGSSFVSRALRVFGTLALAVLGAGGLTAQSTGKVEGRVRDQAGAPIANALVRVQGSAFVAEANAQGYYFLNNVPSGTYNLVANFVGYKGVEVTGVRIPAGQTITQDFALEQTPVELTELTVEAAQNALVPRDEVTSKQRIDGEFVRNLPVDRIGAVLALQPGVVADKDNNKLTIRGGRNTEAVTYIDGVPVSSGARGGYGTSRTGFGTGELGQVQVSANAFEDASVTTGALSAEFGNAQSGLVSVTTRAGGSRFSGNLSYESDEPMGKNHGVGYNRVDAGIGGPIYKNLTFFLGGMLEGRRGVDRGFNALQFPDYTIAGTDTVVAVPSSYTNPAADTSYVTVPRFAIGSGDCGLFGKSLNSGIKSNYGLSCNGVASNFTGRGTYQLSGKLNYTFGQGNRISLTALRNLTQTRLGNVFEVTSPQRLTANQTRNDAYILNWAQNLSKSSERQLTLDVYGSYQEDRVVQGALQPTSEEATRSATGGFMALKKFDFLYDFDNFPITPALVKAWRTNGPGQAPLDSDGGYNSSIKYRLNPYGLRGDLVYNQDIGSSPNSNLRLTREQRYIGRGNLDWQADRYNRLKLGGEFTKYQYHHFNRNMNSASGICFCDAYIENPIRYAMYGEDRLDLGDLVIVGGLRYDYYDSKASRTFLKDSTGALYQFPIVFPTSTDTGILIRDKAHHYLSPHVQVSFPVTDRTNFRLSYAHQVQAPDFAVVYGGINTDINLTNTNQLYGTDLDFSRTVTFEFGVRHSFSEDMVLDVAAYNKDKLADNTVRIFRVRDPKGGVNNQEMRFYTNADFGTVRGIDVRIDRRIGTLFNGTLAYTFQDARNTGTDPFSYVSFFAGLPTAGGGNSPPPQAILPTDDSRPHNIAGSAALSFPADWHQGSALGTILRNVGMFATFRLASGTAYTRCPPISTSDSGSNLFLHSNQASTLGTGSFCDKGIIQGNVNAARLPGFKQFDVRISKSIGFGSNNLTFYADIRNVFNFKNVIRVYSRTGAVTDAAAVQYRYAKTDSTDFLREADQNSAYDFSNGVIDLTNPTAADRCATWVDAGSSPAAPNCIAMRRAEQRYGNGDGLFTVAEQKAASRAFLNLTEGINTFYGLPRRVRLGLEFTF
jgi:hypothetical protein